mmetsp:Transcript_16247/g.33354  ORF Transcript_16247/g.33354 Transcript_16247/m.33354 type:complete len:109 (+) Transcript_16247:136-462(+)
MMHTEDQLYVGGREDPHTLTLVPAHIPYLRDKSWQRGCTTAKGKASKGIKDVGAHRQVGADAATAATVAVTKSQERKRWKKSISNASCPPFRKGGRTGPQLSSLIFPN